MEIFLLKTYGNQRFSLFTEMLGRGESAGRFERLLLLDILRGFFDLE
jgi:hypothetical protein